MFAYIHAMRLLNCKMAAVRDAKRQEYVLTLLESTLLILGASTAVTIT